MKKTLISQTENNQINVNGGKVIIQHNAPNYYNNGGFVTAFSAALMHIAQNKDLSKNDTRLLILLLSYMGEKEIKRSANIQSLLRQSQYSKTLKIPQQRISESFKKLQECGYIKIDRDMRSVEVILINPDMAYNGKVNEYSKIWNEFHLEFGLEERKYNEKISSGKQDWNETPLPLSE